MLLKSKPKEGRKPPYPDDDEEQQEEEGTYRSVVNEKAPEPLKQ